MTRARSYLSRAELAAGVRLLDAHCLINEASFAVYETGWDDSRIHKEIGTEASLKTVQDLRRDVKGKLAPVGPDRTLSERITKLEADVAALFDLLSNQPRGKNQ